jgi:hypothetical protein
MPTSVEIQQCKLREFFLKSWGSLSTTLREDLCLFCYKTEKTTVQKQERPISLFHFLQLGWLLWVLLISFCKLNKNFILQWCKLVCWENIKQAKGNECSQYKSTAASFLRICMVHFHLVMPRHL